MNKLLICSIFSFLVFNSDIGTGTNCKQLLKNRSHQSTGQDLYSSGNNNVSYKNKKNRNLRQLNTISFYSNQQIDTNIKANSKLNPINIRTKFILKNILESYSRRNC